MNKRFLFLLMTFIAILARQIYAQEDITHVSDSAFTRHLRPPVPFKHDAHNGAAKIEECNVCHHVYTNGRRSEDESSEGSECSECHLTEKTDSLLPLTRIYHLQCKGCHMEKKAGPVMCGECHVRAEDAQNP